MQKIQNVIDEQVLPLIYRNDRCHSSFAAEQIQKVVEVLQDAERCQKWGEMEFCLSNLAIVRKQITNLIEVITRFNEPFRTALLAVYTAVDDKMCEVVDTLKGAK
jgi:hypothetical protein